MPKHLSSMTFEMLKKEAVVAGINPQGLTADQLKEMIQAMRETKRDREKSEQMAEEEQEVKKKAVPKAEFVAIVFDDNTNDKKEIRRYDEGQHGPQYENMAKQFAKKYHYEVRMEEKKPEVTCPKCQHSFSPK